MNIGDFVCLVVFWAFVFQFIWNAPWLGLAFPGAIALLASIGLINALKNTVVSK